jgi:hypothetical protein
MNSSVSLVKQNSTAWPGSLFLPLHRVVVGSCLCPCRCPWSCPKKGRRRCRRPKALRCPAASSDGQLMGAVVTKPGVDVRVTVCWRRRGEDSDEFFSYRSHWTGRQEGWWRRCHNRRQPTCNGGGGARHRRTEIRSQGREGKGRCRRRGSHTPPIMTGRAIGEGSK